jgi:site-specific DNA-methyltransferase (adenine-specific)
MLQQDMANKETRIHPTQKPVALYSWILANYAKPGQLILDTHLGSGSSRIAADKAGLNFVGCELDADYFAAQEKRWREYKMQLKLL